MSICVSSSAMADPPITPPVDPSVIPDVPTEYTSPQPAVDALQHGVLKQVNTKIHLYVQADHHWEALMGLPLTRSSYRAASTQSVAYANWVLKLWKTRAKQRHSAAKRWMIQRTGEYLSDVNYMRRVMGQPATRQLLGAGNIESRFNRAQVAHQQTLQRFQNPPQMGNFACIHRYEGAWNDRDSGNNGHFGGVQFGKSEWLRFGYPYTGKLWAYLATPIEQYWAAYRYWLVSGFGPWPQTARDCGLL